MTFIEKLKKAIKQFDSMVCVGIDPDLGKMPKHLVKKYGEDHVGLLTEFCTKIIDKVAPHCCSFKPNLAFFEAFGNQGMEALEQVVNHICSYHPNHVLIIDGKRGDIGNTAGKYALSLKRNRADAVTVNPYLGPKTLEPFLEAGLGIIPLCVTSNPDACIFQNVQVIGVDGDDRDSMYLYVAEVLTKGIQYNRYNLAEDMNEEEKEIEIEKRSFKPSNIWNEQLGFVAGATHPEELAKIRELIGDEVMLLVPGLGAQGGKAKAVVLANGGKDKPAVFNTSRKVLYASSGEDFAFEAGKEALRTKNEINSYLAEIA